jgi:hypothetical protein
LPSPISAPISSAEAKKFGKSVKKTTVAPAGAKRLSAPVEGVDGGFSTVQD